METELISRIITNKIMLLCNGSEKISYLKEGVQIRHIMVFKSILFYSYFKNLYVTF